MEFVCKVGTATGEVVQKTFTAPDEASLRRDLEQQGYYLFSIKRGFLALGDLTLRAKHIPAPHLIVFGQELAALLKRLRGSLARRFGIKPDYLIPVPKESIPKTAVGKIERGSLRRRFEAGEFDVLVRRIELLARNEGPGPDPSHVCDVRNSTAAVESGRYNSVNTLGAAVITGMLNAAGDTQIPFVFEGDGAMLCVPPELLGAARAVLLRTRELVERSFALDLRIATLPVARIREAGADILVGRFRVSEKYVQAMFAGGGMAFADRFMKDPPPRRCAGWRRAASSPRATSTAWNPLAGHPEPPWRDRQRDGQGARR